MSAVFLTVGAARQAELVNQRTHYVFETVPASPGYWGVLANWDGQWYKAIATAGYPTELPTVAGEVAQNEWAFYPLFPTVVRAVMLPTRSSFEVASGLLSLICGGLAMIVLYGMLRRRMTSFASGATVACLSFFPTAFVLQVGYSESLSLLVLVFALRALEDRRYGLFGGLTVVLSLTRPIAPALAIVAGVHWVVRWRREGLPVGLGGWAVPMASVVVPAASVTLWPFLAWISTGEQRAFFLTQEAWRFTRDGSFVAASVFGQAWSAAPPRFLLVLGGLLIVLAVSPLGRPWGPELRAWVLVYPLYILLATQPTMSVYRYLLLALVPWWPCPGVGSTARSSPVSAVLRWGTLLFVLGIEVLLQYHWVMRIYTVDVGPAFQSFP